MGRQPGFEPGLGDPQSPVLTRLHHRRHRNEMNKIEVFWQKMKIINLCFIHNARIIL